MSRLALAIPLALVACTPQPGPPTASPTPSRTYSVPSTTGPTAAACPETASGVPNARQGSGRGVEMWVLIFNTEAEIHAKKELKVVVRFTGPEDTVITAIGPSGSVVTPVWGPEYHGGSNFEHPGSEFGTGWVFPAAGCWTLHAVNSDGVGELTLRVAA
jgi:hypothetical protein